MTYIVDQLFPPVVLEDLEEAIEYTSFNYWRDPVSEVDLDLSESTASTTPESNGHLVLSKPLATIPEN